MVTMQLGLIDGNDDTPPATRDARRHRLEELNQRLRAAGRPEYDEAPANPRDHAWQFSIGAGALERLLAWAQGHLGSLGPDDPANRHLLRANPAFSIFLPDDFDVPFEARDQPFVGSAPRLQAALLASAARLDLPDPGRIPFDFSGTGEGIAAALDQRPASDDTTLLRVLCLTLYQGAALAIARNRALVIREDAQRTPSQP